MNLTTDKMLNEIVASLKGKNIDVHFINSDKDGIEIGELKNGRITLNTNSRDELSLVFTIAHLFGHYCQFRNYDKYKHLIEAVEKPAPIKVEDDFKNKFWEYEKEAFGIGKSLMLEAFSVNDDLDNRYQTFMLTDFEHFWDYITTEENEGVKEFNQRLENNYNQNFKFENHIQPIPVPQFSKEETIKAEVTIY